MFKILTILQVIQLCRPPVGWGSTYCFTDVRIRVSVIVSFTPITNGTPAQLFLGAYFCSVEHWLFIFAMTVTFASKNYKLNLVPTCQKPLSSDKNSPDHS